MAQVVQGYEDNISMPISQDVTKYCSNWNVKFQASKTAWFSETVRWGLIQTASFTLSRHIPPFAQTLISRMSWCQKEPPHFNGNTSLVGKLGWKLIYVDLLVFTVTEMRNISPQQIVHSWNALLTKVYNVTIAILGTQKTSSRWVSWKKGNRGDETPTKTAPNCQLNGTRGSNEPILWLLPSHSKKSCQSISLTLTTEKRLGKTKIRVKFDPYCPQHPWNILFQHVGWCFSWYMPQLNSLAGGFNPFEKYASQIGSFPSGWKY